MLALRHVYTRYWIRTDTGHYIPGVHSLRLLIESAYLRAPLLLLRRHPPQINYPPCSVPP